MENFITSYTRSLAKELQIILPEYIGSKSEANHLFREMLDAVEPLISSEALTQKLLPCMKLKGQSQTDCIISNLPSSTFEFAKFLCEADLLLRTGYITSVADDIEEKIKPLTKVLSKLRDGVLKKYLMQRRYSLYLLLSLINLKNNLLTLQKEVYDESLL